MALDLVRNNASAPNLQPHFPDKASDDGKATRALQSSLADAKVEVEFWKRKVELGGVNGKLMTAIPLQCDRLMT